jgi:hypothetical protein
MPRRIACRRVAAEMPAYAADRLPTTARDRIEQHLETCAACRREVEAYRDVLSLMANAGQSHLPASRTNWQMLAAQMEAPRMPGSRHTATRHRLVLSLAGAATLVFVGVAYNAIHCRKPDTAPQTTVSQLKPLKQAKAIWPPATPYRSTQHDPARQFALNGSAGMKQALRSHMPLIMPHPLRAQHTVKASPLPGGDTAKVQRLLALAARKIDALEQTPPRQQPDLNRFLAALNSARQAHGASEASTLQITVMTAGRTLLDCQVSFVPIDQRGRSWVRQTLLEQANGDCTTETIAATFRPDSSDSFFNLQTCAPANRHAYGDSQP